MLIFFATFLSLATPFLLNYCLSPHACGRWLWGLAGGAIGYNMLLTSLPFSRNTSESETFASLGAGAMLGSVTALAFWLQPPESRLVVGVLVALVAGCVLALYGLDFWSYLRLPVGSENRLLGAIRFALPGLLWSELLLLRAVQLVREGKGWRSTHPAPASRVI